jgi:hypothetical protein
MPGSGAGSRGGEKGKKFGRYVGKRVNGDMTWGSVVLAVRAVASVEDLSLPAEAPSTLWRPWRIPDDVCDRYCLQRLSQWP